MKFINQLREGEAVSEIYLCKSKQSLKTKAGKNYYSILLQDKSGVLDAKVWELTGAIGQFEEMDYIQVEGQVISFQGALQLNTKRIRRCDEGEYETSNYVPVSSRDLEEMYDELMGYVGRIKEVHLKALVEGFFIEDKDFIIAFKKHSAAKSIHHGFVGGLLEHTLAVVKLCNYMSSNYPVLNKDLLLSAALFHDIGKVKELSSFPENDYTNDGQLLGHIVIGVEMIGERIKAIDGFPDKLASQIKHCIIAHHGEFEYGSPKKPAIIEALALSFADNLDAKIQCMTEMFKNVEEKTEWIGYSKLFESNIRKTFMP